MSHGQIAGQPEVHANLEGEGEGHGQDLRPEARPLVPAARNWSTPIDLYQYVDYRLFLKERFEELQARDATFSQRGLSRKAGIANPGFFNEVIKGRRRLSPAATEKMAKGLDLSASDAKYLALMVEYNEAREPKAKQSFCQQMIFRRNRKFVERLAQSHGVPLKNPTHDTVRAAIAACDFRGDFEKLSRFIWPTVPVDTVKRCVLELCEWGLVEQAENGAYQPGRSAQWMAEQESMEMHVHPPEGGAFSTDLVPVSDETYRRIMDRLDETREEMLAWVKEDSQPATRLVQLDLHLLLRSWLGETEGTSPEN
jgi:uncharacterized protein (TIGR02147 family)